MNQQIVPLHDSLGRCHSVVFESSSPLADPGDSAFVLSLPVSLYDNSDLVLDQPVSQLLLDNSVALQDVMRRFLNWRAVHRNEFFVPDWQAQARRIPLRVTPRPAGRRAAGVGCFFSGGLDSFYTLLQKNQEITHLIYVLGYDVFHHQVELKKEVLRRLELIASHFGKTLVVLQTDLRKTSNRLLHWHMYHGAALAAAGHLLRNDLGQIYIPSTYTYEHLVPLGSHPCLDHLWSSHELEFVHHGAGADRPEKALLVGANQMAQEHLRVCWENRQHRYNCGQCEKCRRTLVEFAVAGWEGHPKSIPGTVSWDQIKSMPVDTLTVKFWRNCLNMARSRDCEPQVLEALEARLEETRSKRLFYLLQKIREGLKQWLNRIR